VAPNFWKIYALLIYYAVFGVAMVYRWSINNVDDQLDATIKIY